MDFTDNYLKSYQPGSIIADRYEVVKTLGVGGMGTVVKVIDHALDEEIGALKILNPNLVSDKTQFARFRNEVLLTRKLSHPNIVRIYDFSGTTKGHYYLSLEFVEGGALTPKIYGRGASKIIFSEICKYLLQLCDGLTCAHSKGVIHRDLKPDNVLLDAKGNAKITDFGLARSVTTNNNFTITGETVGTPHYMSPEQLAGETLDVRADIYSLGIMAFEMALGRRPYISESYLELAKMHMESELPSINQLDPSLPKWFEEFVKISTNKRIEDRFIDSEEASAFLIENIQKYNKDCISESMIERVPFHLP